MPPTERAWLRSSAPSSPVNARQPPPICPSPSSKTPYRIAQTRPGESRLQVMWRLRPCRAWETDVCVCVCVHKTDVCDVAAAALPRLGMLECVIEIETHVLQALRVCVRR